MDRRRLRQQLRDDEGEKQRPYKDHLGLWTIAIGRCLEKSPLTGEEYKYLLDNKLITMEINQAGRDWLLDRSLSVLEQQCAARLGFWSRLSDARQNALIEMAYQMGVDGLMKFVGTLRAIREERWPDVEALALDSSWWRDPKTKHRAEIVARQLASGEWT